MAWKRPFETIEAREWVLRLRFGTTKKNTGTAWSVMSRRHKAIEGLIGNCTQLLLRGRTTNAPRALVRSVPQLAALEDAVYLNPERDRANEFRKVA